MRQREAVPFSELRGRRRVHFFMRVAENVGQQALHVVDVLISIHVPHPTSFTTLQKNRCDALHVLRVSLAEGLGTAWNHFFGALQPCLRLHQWTLLSRARLGLLVK